jgi:hypothetical protein
VSGDLRAYAERVSAALVKTRAVLPLARGCKVTAAISLSIVPLLFSGCGLSKSAGPTCKSFLLMSEEDQTKAIIDWAHRHDNRVDAKNPNADGSGFALFQDRGGLITYCQDASHSNDHIGDLSPG